MSRYIIRIQLNHAEKPDYKDIHEAMFNINFFRYIRGKSDTNQWFKLTTAMYYGAANQSPSQLNSIIHNLVMKALGLSSNARYHHEILIVQESDFWGQLYSATGKEKDFPPTGTYLVPKI